MTERAFIDFPATIGVWWASDTWPITDAQEVAREIEALGYGSLFLPEVTGKECLTQSAAFLAGPSGWSSAPASPTSTLAAASAAESGGRTLSALYPGRFVLGLGVSHAPLVEHGFGGVYDKPLATMRTYLEKMAVGARARSSRARQARAAAGGTRPEDDRAVWHHADGAHPYLVLPEQSRKTREILGPDKWIVSEQAVVVGGDDDSS